MAKINLYTRHIHVEFIEYCCIVNLPFNANDHSIAMRHLTYCIFLLPWLLQMTSANANSLNIGFIERPPKIFKTAGGQLRGELVADIEHIFKAAGVNTSYTQFNIQQLDAFLSGNGVDAIMATKILVEPGGEFLFSEKPVYYLQFYVYRLKTTAQASSLAQLSNTSVVLTMPKERLNNQLGAWVNNAENGIKVVAVEKQLDAAWRYIRKDQARYFISYIAPKSYAFDFSQTMQSNRWAADPVFAEPMYLLVKKSVPHGDAIMQRINHQLED